MKLKDKVAIVTGAASGIGQGIALRLAQEGAKVVVNWRKSPADETLKLIHDAGGEAVAIQADVSQPQDVQKLIDETVKQLGRVDIVVNNAGIETKHPFVDYPIEMMKKILDVNLLGPMLVMQAAARQMIKQKAPGRIINISSVHEDLPMPTNAPYCGSKGGLRMMMRTVAVELAPHQITVNNIGPGAIHTDIDADVQGDPEMEKALMAEIPLARWGQPAEVGGLTAYLASDEAGYVTGSTYFIDGGMLRQAAPL